MSRRPLVADLTYLKGFKAALELVVANGMLLEVRIVIFLIPIQHHFLDGFLDKIFVDGCSGSLDGEISRWQVPRHANSGL